jgi:hypothetical protein
MAQLEAALTPSPGTQAKDQRTCSWLYARSWQPVSWASTGLQSRDWTRVSRAREDASDLLEEPRMTCDVAGLCYADRRQPATSDCPRYARPSIQTRGRLTHARTRTRTRARIDTSCLFFRGRCASLSRLFNSTPAFN